MEYGIKEKGMVKIYAIDIINEIAKKLGITSDFLELEYGKVGINTLIVHADGLVSLWQEQKIDKKDAVLMREENNGYRYCIGYIKEYDKEEKNGRVQ